MDELLKTWSDDDRGDGCGNDRAFQIDFVQ